MTQFAPPPRSPLRPLVAQQIGVYNQGHPNRPIDPQAALAVAAQEGLSGGIGDGGHAFGPFQENDAGGVLTGRFPGQTTQQLQQWATSPAGIQDALGQIGGVAGGLKGSRAVQAIVSRFERPADIPGEIARANAAYGGLPAAAGGAPPPPAAAGGRSLASAAAPHNYVPELLQLAHAAQGPQGQPDLQAFYGRLRQALQAPQQRPVLRTGGLVARPGEPPPTQPLPAGRGQVIGNTTGEQPGFLSSLAALAAYEHQPVHLDSGFRSTQKQAQLYANRASNPNPVAPPGHSLHEQGLAGDGTVGGVPLGTLPAAVLARFGLASVPGDPVHVQVRR